MKAAMKANGKVPADSWLSALPNKGEWPAVAKTEDGSLKPEGKMSKKEIEEKYSFFDETKMKSQEVLAKKKDIFNATVARIDGLTPDTMVKVMKTVYSPGQRSALWSKFNTDLGHSGEDENNYKQLDEVDNASAVKNQCLSMSLLQEGEKGSPSARFNWRSHMLTETRVLRHRQEKSQEGALYYKHELVSKW